MEQFIYCNDKETFNQLVNKGFEPLKEDSSPFVLLNNIKGVNFEEYSNVTFSNTMIF